MNICILYINPNICIGIWNIYTCIHCTRAAVLKLKLQIKYRIDKMEFPQSLNELIQFMNANNIQDEQTSCPISKKKV